MYVLQHPDFGLGNFINLTPSIAWLHERHGERIPVYFSTPYVRECFIDWDKIKILDEKPDGDTLFGSHLINPANDMPDYQYAFYVISGNYWRPQYHTYVDTPKITDAEKNAWTGCIVMVNGAGSDAPEYVATKDPGKDAFVDAVAGASLEYPWAKIIAVGSLADSERAPWLRQVADECYFGNIRTALKIISVAGVVIANDTGLAHAAGAMNKNLTVLMKNTPRERVKNPGKNTKYLYL